MQISQVPIQFIEHSIQQGIEAVNGTRKELEGDLLNIYFVGRSLCLDTENEFGERHVLIVNHSDEEFMCFTGDDRLNGYTLRRLLSIKAMKALEKLMMLCEINHTPKYLNK